MSSRPGPHPLHFPPRVRRGAASGNGGVVMDEDQFPLWASWLLAALAALAAAFSALGGGDLELAAYPLFGLAFIFACLSVWYMPSVRSWRGRHRKRKAAEEAARQARLNLESLDAGWRAPTEAWARFYCTVGCLVVACDGVTDSSPTDQDWDRAEDLATRAVEEAREIHVSEARASKLVHSMKDALAARDAEAVRSLRLELHNHTFHRETYKYRAIRLQLGIPSPADYERSQLASEVSSPAAPQFPKSS